MGTTGSTHCRWARAKSWTDADDRIRFDPRASQVPRSFLIDGAPPVARVNVDHQQQFIPGLSIARVPRRRWRSWRPSTSRAEKVRTAQRVEDLPEEEEKLRARISGSSAYQRTEEGDKTRDGFRKISDLRGFMKIFGSWLLIAIQSRGVSENIWIATINCDPNWGY